MTENDKTKRPEFALETVDLRKTYAASGKNAPKEALKGINLQIPHGSFFALLGPNGAGKSTLINILAGLVNKTAGTARIWGYDIDKDMRAARRSIGVVPQELNIDPYFTPREMLDLQAGLYGVPKSERRTDAILEAVGLADKANAYARSLSGGMRRRLLVGKAMVHNPKVLILDEPSAGVDVDLRRQLWSHVKAMNKAGTTVLLTTHYLEEAENLCDRIAIINHGQLIANEPTRTLLGRLDSKQLIITAQQEITHIPAALSRFNPTLDGNRQLTFNYKPSQTGSGEILDCLRTSGITIVDLTTREAELEDIFISMTHDQNSGQRL